MAALLDQSNLSLLLLSLLGGLLPTLFWLWFWLKEDGTHPEPRSLIATTFLAGAIAVWPTYWIERALHAQPLFQGSERLIAVVLIWAAVEEIIKYLAVSFVAFRSREFDEPVDAMIYLLSGALGFAALENGLFIGNTLVGGLDSAFLLTGNFRFLGATLVHVVASAILGGFIAFGLCDRARRWRYTLAGLVAATLLHALFNYLILESGGSGVLPAFLLLWLAAVFVIFFFERVKQITCQISS